MNKYKSQKGNIKLFLIPIVIITFIFIITLLGMSYNVRRYYYDLKQKEALKMAGNISVSLTRTGNMTDTANKLLEDNLLTSLKATSIHSDNFTDELLKELGDALGVDELYIYNSQGIIEHSYTGKYIGRQAYVGHEMYNFIAGDQPIYIEDIRKDSASDLYYKYGYIKNLNDTYIQIGILADKVLDVLDSFEIQYILEDMAVDDSISQLFSIDKYYRVTASTDKDQIGTRIDSHKIRPVVYDEEIYDQLITIDDQEFYEIYVPLEYESDNISAFGIRYSMNDILPVIRTNITIGLVGILIVYSSLIFSLYTVQNRNKKLVQIAFYDNTTGLPNVDYLKEQLSKDLNKTKNKKAIIMIKIDNLDIINLSLGYEYGNLIFKEMGKRLNQIENKNIKLFRFTDEKFVFYVKSYDEQKELLTILERIENLLSIPFRTKKIKEHMTTKIGVVEYKDTDRSADHLLQDATIAINHVDINGHNKYRFYDESMELDIKREESIEKGLRAAMDGEDFANIYLQYQPIVDLKSNKIMGFEALARMKSEQLGFVSPAEFIRIAEEKQLIIPLSKVILKTACRFMANLLKLGFDDIRVSVNISTVHLFRDDFVRTILDIVKETGINGKNLELEITESTFMKNFTIVNSKLKELREHNISIAIDDFGTGYSSFDRLSELNIDTLKIDKHFIDNINDENKTSVITKDIISIAHKLGLKTVAEGVETQEEKDYLLEYNCDRIQGYVFSKPLAEKKAAELLIEEKK